MEIKKFIKKTLSLTCVIFTLVTVIYSLIVLFMNVSAEEILLDGLRVIMFLFFSFLVALGMTVFSISAIPVWAHYLLNYALCAFAFFLCVLLPASDGQTAGFLLVGTFFFTLIYVICAALIALFKSRYKRLNEQEQEYKKHFSK